MLDKKSGNMQMIYRLYSSPGQTTIPAPACGLVIHSTLSPIENSLFAVTSFDDYFVTHAKSQNCHLYLRAPNEDIILLFGNINFQLNTTKILVKRA